MRLRVAAANDAPSAESRRPRLARRLVPIATAVALAAMAGLASAQDASGDPAPALNPVAVVDGAAHAIPGFEGGLSGALNVIVLLTVLTVAPSILIMCTCFTRFVIVLGLLRQAIGTNTLPPSQIVVGLSLFMTFLVMAPTFERIHAEAVIPYRNGDPAMQSQLDVWNRAKEPLRDFMFAQIDAAGNWESVYTILDYRGVDTSDPSKLTYDDVDMLTLIPAFILSELKVSFLIGFRMYLPFLIIDMVISSLLISMGMLMLPPVLISLPFKLLLFVLVDGWALVVGNLLSGYVQPDPGTIAVLLEPTRPLVHHAFALVTAAFNPCSPA